MTTEEPSWWARPALAVITAVVAASYSWGLGQQQPEIYYAAAVRSMATSWHNFFFAAFDPRATISIDKLPGAFWLQALSVRVFGVHIWALNLPQVIEGTVTVLVLYRVVRRCCGETAAIVAAAVYACMPVTVTLNRGNISDSLLILLLVCAADAAFSAVQHGRIRTLLLAGLWVGLAFQAKMMQAWLIMPSLLALWLVASPRPLARRLVGAIATVGVTVLVSLSWMLVITAVPQHDRPYVDGSSHDSLFEQVFEYNGFSRADAGATPVTAGAESLAAVTAAVSLDRDSRADRTIAGPGGRAIGWLLPVALASLILVLIASRGRPRGDPTRAAALFWASWLGVDLVAFTLVSTINAYYLAALTPPVAALIGIGVGVLRDGRFPRLISGRLSLLIATVGVVGYGRWLSAPATIAVQIAELVVAAAWCTVAAVSGRHRIAATLGAMLAAPAIAAGTIVVQHDGPFTTPYQPASSRAITQSDIARATDNGRRAVAAITAANPGARYPAATYSSLLAAPLIFATGVEIEPIGGFRGTGPVPTLDQLQQQVADGSLHTILLLRTADPRAQWVESHCFALPVDGIIHGYYCN